MVTRSDPLCLENGRTMVALPWSRQQLALGGAAFAGTGVLCLL
jgi:hypothetical protein